MTEPEDTRSGRPPAHPLPAPLFWLLLALALVATAFGIERMPLLDPDEGRNAEVAREMAEGGDWVLPRYNDLPYLDKPVLYFAAVAGSFRLFGPGEASARGVSLAFALGALALTWQFGRRRYGSGRARWAVLILATAPLFVGFARIVIFDMALTALVLGAWTCSEEGRRGAGWGFAAAWALAGLAILTKGPVALLLFLIGALCLPRGDGPPLRLTRFFHPLNIAILVAVLAPWVMAMEKRQPGFLHYALFVETAERLTKPSFQRNGPPWYYLPVLLLGLFPWSLPWLVNPLARVKAAWRTLRGANPDHGPLLAVLAIVLFFSLSRSKLGGYVLPVFPLLALLASGAMTAAEPGRLWRRGPALLLLILGIGLLAPVFLQLPLAGLLKQPPGLEPDIHNLLRNIGILLIVVGGAALVASATGHPERAPVALSLFLPGLIAASFGPMMGYAEANSSRAMARVVAATGGGSTSLAAVRCFPTGLPFYLRGPVPLVTDTGRELTSTWVARTFAATRTGSSILWSAADLDAGVRAGSVNFVLTRRREDPPPGFRPAGEYHKVRLWTRER